mmetsp:Transcript_13200/g.31253  ORF Transcript_13200/g.31253 Transcript_13200/m.31253 type:complete len:300 (-) Transcript_13200:945-1844(-)
MLHPRHLVLHPHAAHHLPLVHPVHHPVHHPAVAAAAAAHHPRAVPGRHALPALHHPPGHHLRAAAAPAAHHLRGQHRVLLPHRHVHRLVAEGGGPRAHVALHLYGAPHHVHPHLAADHGVRGHVVPAGHPLVHRPVHLVRFGVVLRVGLERRDGAHVGVLLAHHKEVLEDVDDVGYLQAPHEPLGVPVVVDADLLHAARHLVGEHQHLLDGPLEDLLLLLRRLIAAVEDCHGALLDLHIHVLEALQLAEDEPVRDEVAVPVDAELPEAHLHHAVEEDAELPDADHAELLEDGLLHEALE